MNELVAMEMFQRGGEGEPDVEAFGEGQGAARGEGVLERERNVGFCKVEGLCAG